MIPCACGFPCELYRRWEAFERSQQRHAEIERRWKLPLVGEVRVW